MSALTDLFTSLANKIRSKTGGSDTYTPTEMVDAIDDVYDAGFADATTDITPSDSSPVSLSDNTGYKPTTAGYAIESYSSVTPSDSSPVTLTSGDIVKLGGNGKAVASITEVTPTEYYCPRLYSGNIYTLTTGSYGYLSSVDVDRCLPNNVNPARLSYAHTYYIHENGYAIKSFDFVTPSNPPTAVSRDDICLMTDNGYVISSYSSKTPDDTNPPSVSSGEIVRMGGNGYAIESNPTSLTPSDSSPAAIASGTIYKASAGGYAIESYESKTPAASGTAFSAGFVKMSDAGYAYPTPSFPYKVSGTVPDFSSVNQEQTINTGLSEIKYVLLEATAYNDTFFDQTVLDMDRSWCKQIAVYTNASGATSGVNSSGNSADGMISSSTVSGTLKITGISGGTITVKGANGANYLQKNVKWYAG